MTDKKIYIPGKAEKKLRRFEAAGFIFNAAAASVLHFLYEWSGNELFTALFSSVNESVWEHLKIFSVPYVIWSFVELFCIRLPFRRFAASKVFGLYTMLTLIPVFFYTYTGVFGRNIALVDIISGFLITALAFFVSYRLITRADRIEQWFGAAMVLFAVYCAATAFFTFAPPRIGLFKDPVSGDYGLPV